MLKIDDKNWIPDSEYPVAEEEVNTSMEGLPVCCWHCSKDFPSFPLLSHHVRTSHQGQGTPGQRRHHRCGRCGKVLGSMWKLRQHLASHHTTQGLERGGGKEGVGDHQYGRSSRAARAVVRRQGGDHGYATAHQEGREVQGVQEGVHGEEQGEVQGVVQEVQGERSRRRVRREVQEERTPPGSSVCSEHSYGTKRDSSPEPDPPSGSCREASDHMYSSAKVARSSGKEEVEEQEEDLVEEILTGDGNEILMENEDEGEEEEENKEEIPAVDHLYSQVEERSSRLLRRLLPREGGQATTPDPLTEGGPLHPCTACDKSFPQAYRLKRHVREVHDKEKLYRCPECDKEFFKSTSLVRHKISVHEKVRPFSCPNCDSWFKDRSALKYHTKKKVCTSRAAKA